METPPNEMVPASGCRNPVSRFTKVVLPAPLGPIRPTRAPGTRSTSIDCATTSAPKLLQSPRTERASGAFIGDPCAHAGAERVVGSLAPGPTGRLPETEP